jgi:hypothetical protein
MSPKGPGLCENTLLIIAQGKQSRKGKSLSNAEEGRYLFDSILVAVGSKLVQEGEEGWTGRRAPFCLFFYAFTGAPAAIASPNLLGDSVDDIKGRLERRHHAIAV